MSPLTVQRGGWLACFQEVQTEGGLMVSNSHEEKLAADSKPGQSAGSFGSRWAEQPVDQPTIVLWTSAFCYVK